MKTETIHLSQQDNNGKKEWRMAIGPTEPPRGPGNYGKLKVDREDLGEFTFKIQGSDRKFKSDNPIKITVAPGFPPPGDVAQFTWTLDRNQKQLVLNDPNRDEVPTDYYYQLNFDQGDPLDPIIQNGCCRTQDAQAGGFRLTAEMGAVAVAVAIAAAIALVVARTRRAKS